MLYLSNYAYLQVRDELRRIAGVGDVQVFGSGEYSMRVWLDPDRLASRRLTASDVVRVIREQNVQVAAGVLGAPPAPTDTTFQLSINTQGRLAHRRAVRRHRRPRHAGRTDHPPARRRPHRARRQHLLAAQPARQRAGRGDRHLPASRLERARGRRSGLRDDGAAEGIVSRRPRLPHRLRPDGVRARVDQGGRGNAVRGDPAGRDRRGGVPADLARLDHPAGGCAGVAGRDLRRASLGSASRSTRCRSSAWCWRSASSSTMRSWSWRTSSGTSSSVRRRSRPRKLAMEEVSGPIIAIALVLCAVFVPTAFISGLSGQFYRQFALTIAISTVISAFNSLTLSPALASLLLQPHGAPRDRVQRGIDVMFGWFFRLFNAAFRRGSNAYAAGVGRVLRVAAVAVVVYLGLIGLDLRGLPAHPGRIRADAGQAVPRRLRAAARCLDARPHRGGDSEDVGDRARESGGGALDRVPGPVGQRLRQRAECRHQLRGAQAVRGAAGSRHGCQQRGCRPERGASPRFRRRSSPSFRRRRCRDWASVGGFKLYVEDRAGLGFEELYAQLQEASARAAQRPELAGLFSSFQVSVPQVDAHVDRERVKTYGVPLGRCLRDAAGLPRVALRQRLQPVRPHLPGERAGGVVVPHCSPSRSAGSRRATPTGSMVPLGSLVSVEPQLRPGPGDALQRLSRRRDQRRTGAGLQLGPGAAADHGGARTASCPTAWRSSGPS